MGVLTDYFAADDDAAAAGVIDRGSRPYDTVDAKGIDPIVQMGTLEVLLAGGDLDALITAPGRVLAVRDGGQRLVCTVTDTLAAALARATDEDLQRVAGPWSQTEEFWGGVGPEDLMPFLRDMAGLASRARDRGRRLYCWVSM